VVRLRPLLKGSAFFEIREAFAVSRVAVALGDFWGQSEHQSELSRSRCLLP
jgi:hypothetical protein